jgi:ATP-dependent DNA helicase RecG
VLTPLPESLKELRGVGPALTERLRQLGVERPVDLLFLLPQRYEDRTRLTPLGALRPGTRVMIEAEVALADVVFRRRRTLLVRLTDNTGQLTLRFFHFSKTQQDQLRPGTRVRCYGEIRLGGGTFEIVHPEYRVLNASQPAPLEDRLTPVYPAVEGLTQFRLRDLCAQVLARSLTGVRDWLGEFAGEELTQLPGAGASAVPTLANALRELHRPAPGTDLARLAAGLHPAVRRLALEELLAQHLALRSIRERARSERAVALPAAGDLQGRFIKSLGFQLTAGQQAALADIEGDLALATPMMRLVQGDVGRAPRRGGGSAGGHHGSHRAAGGAAPGQLPPLVRAPGRHRGLAFRQPEGRRAAHRGIEHR